MNCNNEGELKLRKEIQLLQLGEKIFDKFTPIIDSIIQVVAQRIKRFFNVSITFKCQNCGNNIHQFFNFDIFSQSWHCTHCHSNYYLK